MHMKSLNRLLKRISSLTLQRIHSRGILLIANFSRYNTIIQSCLIQGKIADAERWMYLLDKSEDIAKPAYTLFLKVDLYCRTGRVAEALEIFEKFYATARQTSEIAEHTIRMLEIVRGKIPGADALKDIDWAWYILPEEDTNFEEIEAIADENLGVRDDTPKLLRPMTQDNTRESFSHPFRADKLNPSLDDPHVPTHRMYLPLIRLFLATNDSETVHVLAKDMKVRYGLNLPALKLMMLYHGDRRDYQSLITVFEEKYLPQCEELSIKVDVQVWDTVLRAHARLGCDIPTLWKILERVDEHGTVPDTRFFNSILYRGINLTSDRAEQRELLERVVQEMKARGLEPDHVTSSVFLLINGTTKEEQKKPDPYKKMLKSMFEKDVDMNELNKDEEAEVPKEKRKVKRKVKTKNLKEILDKIPSPSTSDTKPDETSAKISKASTVV